jgi:chromosomal replication initiation ATPase DnaA
MIEKTGKAPGEEELAQIVSYLDDIIPQGAAIREIAGFFIGTLELSAGIAPISLQLVQNCFGQRDLFPADVAEAQASAERILGIADKLFPGISLSKLISPSREREVFRVRMRLMWLIKKLVPGITDYEIGMHFGGREHSTVNVALKQAKSLSEGEQQRLLAEASKMLGLRNA